MLKTAEVVQVDQCSDVALDVGLQVTVEKSLGVQTVFVESGKESLDNQIKGFGLAVK